MVMNLEAVARVGAAAVGAPGGVWGWLDSFVDRPADQASADQASAGRISSGARWPSGAPPDARRFGASPPRQTRRPGSAAEPEEQTALRSTWEALEEGASRSLQELQPFLTWRTYIVMGLTAFLLSACMTAVLLATRPGMAPAQQDLDAPTSGPAKTIAAGSPWEVVKNRHVVMTGKASALAGHADSPGGFRMLLESPELHKVATQNIMKVGHLVFHDSDRTEVEAAVAAGFKHLSSGLQEHSPEVTDALSSVRLTEKQRDAVLSTMRLMSEPRVRSVGLDIARAIRKSRSTERPQIMRCADARLRPRLKEISQLHDDLIPSLLRGLGSRGHQWDLTFDPTNIRAMEHFSEEWYLGVGDIKPTKSERSNAILAAVLEHGRVFLDVAKLYSRLFGKGTVVPEHASSMVGKLDTRPTTCSGGGADMVKALVCPLKFGAQGMDALRAVYDVLKIAPDMPPRELLLDE